MRTFLILFVLFLTSYIESSSQSNLAQPNLTDHRDNKVYKTIKIGMQVWLAQNIAFNIKDGSWPLEMKKENEKKYGLLYSWKEAQKACPSGWHLPTKEEWKELLDFVGQSEIYKGAFLNETGWDNSVSGNNSSGFSALPGGCIDKKNVCLEQFAQFWTSSEFEKKVYYILIDANAVSIHSRDLNELVCSSVRCLKNK